MTYSLIQSQWTTKYFYKFYFKQDTLSVYTQISSKNLLKIVEDTIFDELS